MNFVMRDKALSFLGVMGNVERWLFLALCCKLGGYIYVKKGQGRMVATTLT